MKASPLIMRVTSIKLLTLLLCMCAGTCALAQVDLTYFQDHSFDRADSLRGALRPERTSFDVTYYELHLDVDIEDRELEGRVEMEYTVLAPTKRIQIDLFRNMGLDRIVQQGKELKFNRVEDAVFVDFPTTLPVGTRQKMTIHYGWPLLKLVVCRFG